MSDADGVDVTDVEGLKQIESNTFKRKLDEALSSRINQCKKKSAAGVTDISQWCLVKTSRKLLQRRVKPSLDFANVAAFSDW